MSEEVVHSCELPEDAIPMAVVEIVQYLGAGSEPCVWVRIGGSPSAVTLLGMLSYAQGASWEAIQEIEYEVIEESDEGDE